MIINKRSTFETIVLFFCKNCWMKRIASDTTHPMKKYQASQDIPHYYTIECNMTGYYSI